jgi:hypothetical protein
MVDICLCGIAREDCDYHKSAPVVSKVPVYDVSGTSFIPGVTNFTCENLFDATVNIDGIIKIVVHIALYHKLYKNNLLDFYSNGIVRLQGIQVLSSTDPQFRSTKNGRLFDSTITALDGSQIILRMREY